MTVSQVSSKECATSAAASIRLCGPNVGGRGSFSDDGSSFTSGVGFGKSETIKMEF